MVPLPIVIPMFQMITEKAPTNSPVEDRLPRRDAWKGSVNHDGEKELQDEDELHVRDATKGREASGTVAIDMNVQPALEENAPDTQAGNDVEFEYPRLSPNHGRKDTRFRSFPSISAWSSRSSFSVTRPHRFRSALQQIWAFVLQNDGSNAEHEFIPNYRWLPILSGVTIPFAILLQIPGLTERWYVSDLQLVFSTCYSCLFKSRYVRTENNLTIDSRPNPSILLAGNIVAMIAALVANVCLIVRFLEKRVKQMTVTALCLLSVHGSFVSSHAQDLRPR